MLYSTLVQEILTARILDDRYYDGKKLRRFFPYKIGAIFRKIGTLFGSKRGGFNLSGQDVITLSGHCSK